MKYLDYQVDRALGSQSHGEYSTDKSYVIVAMYAIKGRHLQESKFFLFRIRLTTL